MSNTHSIKSKQLLCLMLLFFIAVSNSISGQKALQDQVDKKARAIFNQKSQLKNFSSSRESQTAKLLSLQYQSGLKAKFRVTDKSISIPQYEYGKSSTKAFDSKWSQTCNSQKPKIYTSSQIDAYLKSINQISADYIYQSFKVLADGYLIIYLRKEVTFTFQLEFNLKIRRRDQSSSTNNQITISQTTRTAILQYINKKTNFQQYKIARLINIQRQRTETSKYTITFSIQLKKRTITYFLILIESAQNVFAIQEGKFKLDFTTSYTEQRYDDQFLNILNTVVKRNMKLSLPSQLKFMKILSDQPYFKVWYNFNDIIYVVQIVYDFLLEKASIINIQQTPNTQPNQKPVSSIDNTQLTQTKIRQMHEFTKKYFGITSGQSKIDKITRVGSQRYIAVLILTIRKRQVKYQIIINQNNGQYNVQDSQFNLDFQPVFQQWAWTAANQLQQLNLIVRTQLKQKIPKNSILSKAFRDDPYFRFIYIFESTRYQIEFVYNHIIRKVIITNVETQKIVEYQQPINKQTVKINSKQQVKETKTQNSEQKQKIVIQVNKNSESIPKYDMQKTNNILTITKADQVTKLNINSLNIPSQVKKQGPLGRLLPGQKFNSIPSTSFVLLNQKENPILLRMAQFALSQISTQISQMDPSFRVKSLSYYIQRQDSVVFRFQIQSQYGILTYYYEVIATTTSQVQIQDYSVNVPSVNIIQPPVYMPKQPENIPSFPVVDAPINRQKVDLVNQPKQTLILKPDIPKIDQKQVTPIKTTVISNKSTEFNTTIVPITVTIQKQTLPKQNASFVSISKKKQITDFITKNFRQVNIVPTNGFNIQTIARVSERFYTIVLTVFIRTKYLKYQISISQPAVGQYTIDDEHLILDFTPTYQQVTDLKQVQNIDLYVRKAASTSLSQNFKLIKAERDEPFYRFYYFYINTQIMIDFNFDVLSQKVIIVNLKKTTSKVVQQAVPVRPVVTVVNKQQGNLIKQQNIVKIISVNNQSDRKEVTKKQTNQPKQTKYVQKSVQTKRETLPANNKIVDINIIKQKTSIRSLPCSQTEINRIYDQIYRQNKQLSLSKFTIYRIQKVTYGFRVIFTNIDIFYESIIKYNPTIDEYVLLRWKTITQQEADLFQLSSISISISLNKDLQAILLHSFPRDKLGQIKQILQANFRISSDGYYYTLQISTLSQNKYEIVIYQKPQQNYTQIMSYDRISFEFGFDYQLLKRNSELINYTYQNIDVNRVLQFINQRFSASGSFSLLYVYRHPVRTSATFYRIGFKTNLGIYYEIQVFDTSNNEIILKKYYKMYNAYSIARLNEKQSTQLVQFYRKQLQVQQKYDLSKNQILVRDLPSIGKFYIIVFSSFSVRYSVVIYVTLAGHIRMASIGQVPQYFDIVFNDKQKGYGILSQIINTCKQSKVKIITNTRYSIETIIDATFDINCLRVKDKKCIKCAYRYVLKQNNCMSVPDQCKDYNQQNGQCYSCYSGYSLDKGVCSQMDILCQMAGLDGLCVRCYKGYTLVQGSCYKSEAVTSSGLRKQRVDALCEQYNDNVCIKCTPGTYMSKKQKKCTIKDAFVQQFDEQNQVIKRCMRGYSAINNQCIRSM